MRWVVGTILVIVLCFICNKMQGHNSQLSNRGSSGTSETPTTYGRVPTVSDLPDISPAAFYQQCYNSGYGRNLTVVNGLIAVASGDRSASLLTLPFGSTLSEAGANFYSEVGEVTKNRNLGGVKLLWDISAQASGILDVNNVQAGTQVQFYPAGAWGVVVPNEKNSLFVNIMSGDIIFVSGKVSQ